jgi:hypothetical protein
MGTKPRLIGLHIIGPDDLFTIQDNIGGRGQVDPCLAGFRLGRIRRMWIGLSLPEDIFNNRPDILPAFRYPSGTVTIAVPGLRVGDTIFFN